MDTRAWWLAANIVTCFFTGSVCVLLLIMLEEARRKLDIAGQPEDARAWIGLDIDYLWSKLTVNAGICLLGLVMIAVAIERDRPVAPFVPLGTAGFSLIWGLNAYTEYRGWWRLHEVAELSARLAGQARERRAQRGGVPDDD